MRKTIKKFLSLCLAVVATLSFASCGGKSAYEIAVENGFQGDEKAWLEYLQGADGKDGAGLNIREIYEEACKGEDGYKGTFLEFLKEYLGDVSLDITEDNNVENLAENIMSVVSVQAFSSGYAGSGVVVELDKESGDALILTNYHVLYNPSTKFNSWKEKIYVYPFGAMSYTTRKESDGTYTLVDYGDGIECEYVGGALEYDIAVLRVEDSDKLKESNLMAAEIGVSNEQAIGEKVFAIGNPKGLGISVTEGILSLDSEYIDVDMDVPSGTFPQTIVSKPYPYRVMRTDAAINSGNSGGGLFNSEGKLIGIINAKAVTNIKYDEHNKPYIDEKDGMGYALPITQVKYVMENILANNQANNALYSGKILKAKFGITTTVTDSVAGIGNDGKLYIKEEVSVYLVGKEIGENGQPSTFDCIANGKFKEGDILKTIQIGDGEIVEVTRRFTVQDYLLNVRLGDTVKVVVERAGGNVELVFEFNDLKYFTVI